MPEFAKCWNEACFLYGQLQPADSGVCEQCSQPLKGEVPAQTEMGKDISFQQNAER